MPSAYINETRITVAKYYALAAWNAEISAGKTYKGWGLIKTRATLLWEPTDKILNAPLVVELKNSKKYWTAWNPLRFIRASEVTSVPFTRR